VHHWDAPIYTPLAFGKFWENMALMNAAPLTPVMLALAVAATVAPPAPAAVVTVGRSVRGTAITMTIVGSPDAQRKILVVGCVHGTERAGEAVVRRLQTQPPPPGTALLLIKQINPDGCAAGTRGNAHGVDLNRNAPWAWRPLPRGTYYSGATPLSEPESRAINRLVKRFRPAVSIWYHQHASLVNSALGDLGPKRMYAQMTGLPLRNFGTRPGSITSWQKTSYPSSVPFVVELPAGRLSYRQIRRHANAVLALAAR
jgi:protein MpaA